jgi:membrane-associated protease RseP (regulator of RpoE activity)
MDITTDLILLAAVLLLGWGLYRALPLGQLGILAWLQSVVLMSPWLLLFGLMSAGVSIGLAGILLLLVSSVVVYIALGRRLRSLAAQMQMPSRTQIPTTQAPIEVGEGINQIEIPTIIPELPETTPVPAEDLQVMKSLFGVDTFFATETIPYQDGVIFKGNLRSEPEPVWTALTQSLIEKLGDRYRLFLVSNNEEKPVVIILPSRNDPPAATMGQKILAVVLFVATIATSLGTAGFLLGFDVFQNPERLPATLPIGLGLLSTLIVHEAGHRVVAQRKQVKLSWPFFLPALQIGSFGTLNRFESLLPNRSVLFDVSIAGPAASGIYSLVILFIGLVLSRPESLFKVPVVFLQGSVLVGTLARVVLGDAVHADIVAIHPLVVVGWIGLVITALNLMPAGQLDGGRMVQAVYGRKVAGRTTVVTLIFLGLASLVNPLALYWAALILVLQRNLERPSLNELSEPDDTRAALTLFALFVMISVLIPLSPSLAGRLGIGG